MSSRIANIGLVHQASLAGMEAGIASGFGVEVSAYHDHLIYTAMVQAGVQRFRVLGGMSRHVLDSNFLRNRCKEYSMDEYKSVMDLVQETFPDPSPQTEASEPNLDLVTLRIFLTDLILALRTKSAMVSVFGIPEVSKYKGKLTPDRYSAINGLIGVIEPVTLNLPVPQWNILSRDVKVFQEIISSDIFKSYSSSHKMFESSLINEQLVTSEIIHQSKAVLNKFGRVLEIRELSLSLIPLTTRLIDGVCGKLPGSIAGVFGEALADALKKRMRITVYNYGEVHRKLLLDYYRSIASLQKNIQRSG